MQSNEHSVINPDIDSALLERANLLYQNFINLTHAEDLNIDKAQILHLFISSQWLMDFFDKAADEFCAVCHQILNQSSQGLVNETQLDECQDEIEFSKLLRLYARQRFAYIIMAELLQVHSTKDTIVELTQLAQNTLQKSYQLANKILSNKHGNPAKKTVGKQELGCGFVIMGMGKLGGYELNLSSDVDLIFAYSHEGMTEIDEAAEKKQRSISHSQFYTKLAQLIIRYMDEVTAYGRVFRVDARLRPHGDSGALTLSFSAIENYYQIHGREWERYAWIKARCVAGDKAQGQLLLKRLTPFIYRKYVDYRIVRSIREMKSLIDVEIKQGGIENNIKLGRGGIRLIEFFVQTYQLLYAGRYRVLINQSLHAVLLELNNMGMVDEDQKNKLYAAYLFLRTLEHRIQMFKFEQTHSLPNDKPQLARIAWSLGYESVNEFYKDLEKHREYVQHNFSKLTSNIEGKENNPETDSKNEDEYVLSESLAKLKDIQIDLQFCQLLWQKILQEEDYSFLFDESKKTFANRYFCENTLRAINSYACSKTYKSMGSDGLDILQSLLPKIIFECLSFTLADDSNKSLSSDNESFKLYLERCFTVISSIGQRASYLELLNSNQLIRSKFIEYVSLSPWVCQWIAKYPIVIEALIDNSEIKKWTSSDHYANALLLRLKNNDNIEVVMDVLRQFHHSHILKIALIDMQDKFSNKKALATFYQQQNIKDETRQRLSWLAEALINVSVSIAVAELKERFDIELDEVNNVFGVIAYGKLGTNEISYDSDLDLIFLYDNEADFKISPQERSYYFSRLARKIISILSIPTTSGVLYEIDARLRPSGNSGMLVTSFVQFDKYQHNEAWIWEHQALIKSNMIYGSDNIKQIFEKTRMSVLCQSRDLKKLKKEVVEMRHKMKSNAQQNNLGQSYKFTDAGLVDIEFYCQYMVLANAKQFPDIADARSVNDILMQLKQSQIIEENECQTISALYYYFLYRENYDKLHQNKTVDNKALLKTSDQKEISDIDISEQESNIFSAALDYLNNKLYLITSND